MYGMLGHSFAIKPVIHVAVVVAVVDVTHCIHFMVHFLGTLKSDKKINKPSYLLNFLLVSGAYIIKPFTMAIYKFHEKVAILAPGRPFQPSLMFVGKARSLPKKGIP